MPETWDADKKIAPNCSCFYRPKVVKKGVRCSTWPSSYLAGFWGIQNFWPNSFFQGLWSEIVGLLGDSLRGFEGDMCFFHLFSTKWNRFNFTELTCGENSIPSAPMFPTSLILDQPVSWFDYSTNRARSVLVFRCSPLEFYVVSMENGPITFWNFGHMTESFRKLTFVFATVICVRNLIYWLISFSNLGILTCFRYLKIPKWDIRKHDSKQLRRKSYSYLSEETP